MATETKTEKTTTRKIFFITTPLILLFVLDTCDLFYTFTVRTTNTFGYAPPHKEGREWRPQQ